MRGEDVAAYVVALLALGFAFGLFVGRDDPAAIPNCPEDSVLVGVGNFEHGQWDAYECGPAFDDYVRN